MSWKNNSCCMDYEGVPHLSDVEQSGVECVLNHDCKARWAGDFYHTAVTRLRHEIGRPQDLSQT